MNEIFLILSRILLWWGIVTDDLSVIVAAGFYMVALTIETNKEG